MANVIARRRFVRVAAGVTISAGALAVSSLSGCAYRHIPGYQFSPALFEVRLPDSQAITYLFGSVHAGLARFYPLPKKIENCIGEARTLAVEIDMQAHFEQATQLFRPHVYLPSTMSLSSVLGINNFDAMSRHFQWFREDIAKHERYAPWFVALNLNSTDDQNVNLQGAVGLETVLLAQAKKGNKVILELETAAEQVHAFVAGSLDEQREHLLMRFDQIRRWDKTIVDIVDAWRLGDLEALDEVKTRNYGGPAKLQSLRTRIFAERDVRMAARIMNHMKATTSTTFAVVGAFHLCGADRLQNFLVDAGASVTRVQY
jgi:uncharacterized protein